MGQELLLMYSMHWSISPDLKNWKWIASRLDSSTIHWPCGTLEAGEVGCALQLRIQLQRPQEADLRQRAADVECQVPPKSMLFHH